MMDLHGEHERTTWVKQQLLLLESKHSKQNLGRVVSDQCLIKQKYSRAWSEETIVSALNAAIYFYDFVGFKSSQEASDCNIYLSLRLNQTTLLGIYTIIRKYFRKLRYIRQQLTEEIGRIRRKLLAFYITLDFRSSTSPFSV